LKADSNRKAQQPFEIRQKMNALWLC